jgi:hypothetical protein
MAPRKEKVRQERGGRKIASRRLKKMELAAKPERDRAKQEYYRNWVKLVFRTTGTPKTLPLRIGSNVSFSNA